MDMSKLGKFAHWVLYNGGPERIGPLLGITPQGVWSWLRKQSSPTPRHAVQLVQMGKGEFDHNDIIKDTYTPRAQITKRNVQEHLNESSQ